MPIRVVNDYGNVVIEESVIEDIIGIKIKECYGIVEMSGKNRLFEIIKKEKNKKGISVKIENNKLIINLSVVIQYGVSIGSVSENIIDYIKYFVEETIGVDIEKINVNIKDVKIK